MRVKRKEKSAWNNYYGETILSKEYLEQKEKLIRQWIGDIGNGRVLDLGCNDGYFSRIPAEKGSMVIAVDLDSQCIGRLYLTEKTKLTTNVLPLCVDISNPSPATGFRNVERLSFVERAKSETVLALALVHHLVLGKNIPMPDVAKQLAELTNTYLIVEFVPIQDEKSQQLIRDKISYHRPYDEQAFEESFSAYFSILKKSLIPGTERSLYLMKKNLPQD